MPERKTARLDAQVLFNLAFFKPRDPRSDAYKAGILAAIRHQLGETRSVTSPYEIGSAEFDAFQSGAGEGHRIGREAKEGGEQ